LGKTAGVDDDVSKYERFSRDYLLVVVVLTLPIIQPVWAYPQSECTVK
jgi:hypothetical protein